MNMHPESILVLCAGNHCRSPIAEGLLRAELGPGVRIESAGLGAQPGYAPHPEAIRLMAERGINITTLRSRRVTTAQALAADLILVMDREQKAMCEAMDPAIKGRVHLLGHWLPQECREISDPMGRAPETFAQVFERIRESVRAWSLRLALSRRPA
jgi:protein-tyrosine phosphatase